MRHSFLVVAMLLSLGLASPTFAQTEPVTAPSPDATAVDPGTPTTADTEMPATASPLAATGLLGLLSLGGAALLRMRRHL